ncbi:putative diguanylate cyclase AdrA [Geobacter sp. OR-1]|uniref:GGDEF domain-containing protein n=1 Tax=Geobacter sp. OR-1 TaxID=1266765 RepID=UPI000542105A|nr:GGDEF domain-containing protein [Geobacter sp. OR-1]GAM11082.1 putative diguanylate cyclase AdrA [Geobacter sp. OR-1]
MRRHIILVVIALISVLIVISLPLYLEFIAYPAYEEFLVTSVEQEMQVLAKRMVKGNQFTAPISQDQPLPEKFIKSVEYIQRTVGLPKIKIFTKSGVIVYSTDQADVGHLTSKKFFPQMLVDGLPRSEVKIVNNNEVVGDIQMIETYVPIIDNGVAVGAFEIYRNITQMKQTFENMKKHEQRTMLPVIILLLAGGLLSTYLADKSMTELDQSKEIFQQLSVTDTLTGLLNRRGFTAAVEKQLTILQRSGTGAFLLYIDLDDFKLINDTCGHKSGDQALVEASAILNNTFRASDIIGRIGGDEFAILTVHNRDPNAEEQIKQRLFENLARWNSRKTFAFELALSVGVVEYIPGSPASIDELMSSADAMMYAEKQQKKTVRTGAV